MPDDKFKQTPENPDLDLKMEPLPFQLGIVNTAVDNIKQKRNTFFAVVGEDFGCGKTQIAVMIGQELKNSGYDIFKFNMWSARPEILRKEFLNNINEQSKKCCLKKHLNKMSIKLGKPVSFCSVICLYTVLWLSLSIFIFSLCSGFINMFLDENIPLVIDIGLNTNWYFVVPLIGSVSLAFFITCLSARGMVQSIFGFGLNINPQDVSEDSFKTLFKHIIKKNTYIILDDIERSHKSNIDNAINFIELLKESCELINNNYTVSVCTPYTKTQMIFLFADNITKYEEKPNKDPSFFMVEDEDKTNSNFEIFLDKLFMKIYGITISELDLKILLSNVIKNIDSEAKEKKIDDIYTIINKCFSFLHTDNLRQVVRNINTYYRTFKFYDDKDKDKLKNDTSTLFNSNFLSKKYREQIAILDRIQYTIGIDNDKYTEEEKDIKNIDEYIKNEEAKKLYTDTIDEIVKLRKLKQSLKFIKTIFP